MRHWKIVCGVAVALPLSACATLAHGTTQEIGFTSSPARARVVVDGVPAGVTPVVTALARRRDHAVRIELEGFQPYEATLTRAWSGWVLANYFSLGIGLIVDLATGGLYVLSPDLVTGQLAKQSASRVTSGADVFHIVLVQHADSSWTRVSTLRRQ
jgi:hypothetical protein